MNTSDQRRQFAKAEPRGEPGQVRDKTWGSSNEHSFGSELMSNFSSKL
jgi:hypothetical protein